MLLRGSKKLSAAEYREHAGPCPLADSEKLMCALHDEMLVNPDDFFDEGMCYRDPNHTGRGMYTLLDASCSWWKESR